ncbi:hypothetical protein SAMN06298215_0226 [Bacteroidales bacterium WCE2008]|nr:hypothetical protein SAMN06298215_0226 [Bacteroidales bacterium WCE2008]
MKNLIVGVAAAAVLAAGALLFSSVKVSARVEPYLDVYFGCTGPVIPAYAVDGRTVGVCANRSIYQCPSSLCDKIPQPMDPTDIDNGETAKLDPDICPFEPAPDRIDDPSTQKIN